MLVIAGLAIFAASLLGILCRPVGFLSAFWPANQVFLVFLLRIPSLMQPGGLAVMAAGYLAADLLTGSSPAVAAGFTLANMAGGLAAWWILHKQSPLTLRMRSQSSALMVFFGSGVASLVSGIIGAPISAHFFGTPLYTALYMWCSGEWANAMILLPFLLALPSRLPSAPARPRRKRWNIVPVLAAVLLEIGSYFMGGFGTLAFSLPALLWCALSYRVLTVAIITMVIFAIKVLVISQGALNFTPDNLLQVVSLRLGVAMSILGPLTVAGAHAMTRQRLHRIRRAAYLDYLTKVLSRGGFITAAQKQLKRLQQQPGPVAMLMLDVDHFKRVNDRYGHATGDQLLQDMARVISQALRPQDVLGRFGGEEFAVLLPEISQVHALAVANRLCAAVRQHRFTTLDGQPLRATVSIGLRHCTSLDEQDSVDALLRSADTALYEAKAQGRNKVVLASA